VIRSKHLLLAFQRPTEHCLRPLQPALISVEACQVVDYVVNFREHFIYKVVWWGIKGCIARGLKLSTRANVPPLRGVEHRGAQYHGRITLKKKRHHRGFMYSILFVRFGYCFVFILF
jgi:hypothetical protein